MAARTYTTSQGDWYDSIALKVYSDEHLMHELIEANYDYRNVKQFSADIVLTCPELPSKKKPPLVPWQALPAAPVILAPTRARLILQPAEEWFWGPTDPPDIVSGSKPGDYWLNTISGDVFELA